MSKIYGTLESKKSCPINIRWYWDYDGNDSSDTLEGKLDLSYSFDVSLIIEKIV